MEDSGGTGGGTSSRDGIDVIRVNNRSGSVQVYCEDRPDILIERGGNRTERDGTQLSVQPSGAFVMRCPAGIALVIGSLSGRVEVHGRAGPTRVSTASGSIQVAEATKADVRSISGSIKVGRVGAVRAATKSGSIEIGSASRADVATVSGRATVESVSGEVRAKTVSGRVEIGSAGREEVHVHTISGRVTVRLPEGVRPEIAMKSVGGRLDCTCPRGTDCRVSVSTLSGRVEVVPS
ncbi:MAG: DUF4097 family beta strand repeat protein [Dehalococcoidia bacterium]|nr:DUF4097 family beta strand repeat protein [Dehalococcoidia bacterium]